MESSPHEPQLAEHDYELAQQMNPAHVRAWVDANEPDSPGSDPQDWKWSRIPTRELILLEELAPGEKAITAVSMGTLFGAFKAEMAGNRLKEFLKSTGFVAIVNAGRTDENNFIFLLFSTEEWSAWLDGVKNNEFDGFPCKGQHEST